MEKNEILAESNEENIPIIEKKDRFKATRLWIFKHMVWLLLLLSAILILISKINFFVDDANIFLEKLGFTVASSGVFAAVLKSIQFTGIFRSEMEDIILGNKFIKRRNNKEELWKTVSKAIYQKRFPKISKRLNSIVLNKYFPKNKNYYYDNYVITLTIKKLQKDGLIKFSQNICYDVIMETGHTKAVLKGGYALDKPDPKSKVKHTNNRVYFKINGKDKLKKMKPIVPIDTGFNTIYHYEFAVKNKGRFSVEMKDIREYNIFEDNCKLFRTSAITKSMKFCVSYPENMHVQFFNLGITGEFKQLHIENPNSITREYINGLILPNQGFGISFGFKSIDDIK